VVNQFGLMLDTLAIGQDGIKQKKSTTSLIIQTNGKQLILNLMLQEKKEVTIQDL